MERMQLPRIVTVHWTVDETWTRKVTRTCNWQIDSWLCKCQKITASLGQDNHAMFLMKTIAKEYMTLTDRLTIRVDDIVIWGRRTWVPSRMKRNSSWNFRVGWRRLLYCSLCQETIDPICGGDHRHCRWWSFLVVDFLLILSDKEDQNHQTRAYAL